MTPSYWANYINERLSDIVLAMVSDQTYYITLTRLILSSSYEQFCMTYLDRQTDVE